MLKTINLFRFGVGSCGKCRSLMNRISTSAVFQKGDILLREKLKFLEDEKMKYENTFGDIECFERKFERIQDDPEDIAEYNREKAALGKSIGEYKEEISTLLSQHKYKAAIRVLEVDMANDKIHYDFKVIGIFRMLFNYTAQKGDLEEAYRLYVRYRNRQGRMTAPMYTSLFNACANCKNSLFALEKAEIIRENLAKDKFHKVNIFNYNSMLKAFGRHGDVPTCLKIFDEVLEKRLKAFTYTYNFLLQSCISDKNSGLRHALLIWRKMLQHRRKPDVWFFNLFLRCVRDCSLGEVALLPDLIQNLKKGSGKFFKKKIIFKKVNDKIKKEIITVPVKGLEYIQFIEEGSVKPVKNNEKPASDEVEEVVESSQFHEEEESDVSKVETSVCASEISQLVADEVKTDTDKLEVSENEEVEDFTQDNIQVLESKSEESGTVEDSRFLLPNLMDLDPSIGSVVEFGALTEPHQRIMLFGGVTGFLETMAKFKVKPNVLTLSLLLGVSPLTEEAEQKIIDLAKLYNIQLDAPFFSQLLRKRIYSDRFHLIKNSLLEMQKANVQPDLVFFGVLAFGCQTCEMGMELLDTLKVYGYRANTEIMYGLLHVAGRRKDFAYVKAILERAKADEVELDSKFVARLGKIVRSEAYKRLKSTETNVEN